MLALLLPSLSLLKVSLCLSPGVCRPEIGSHCAKLMWRQKKYRSQQAGSYLKGDRASPWQAGDGDSITVESHKLFWLQCEPKDLQYCHSLLPLSLVAFHFISKDEICICHYKKFVGFFFPHKDHFIDACRAWDSSSKKTYELSLFVSILYLMADPRKSSPQVDGGITGCPR